MDAPETVASASPESQHGRVEHGGNVNNIRIDLGGKTMALMAVMMLVIAACALVMGLNLAKQADEDRSFKDAVTQWKLVERRLVDAEAYDIIKGIKIPGDDTHGPTGNLERMKHKGDNDGRR